MFKQLHVWSSKEATGNEEKKPSVELEMGYCPFEHWLGRTRRLGAGRRRALGRGRAGVGSRGRGRSARGSSGREAGVRGARAAGRAAGPAGCALGAHSLFFARFDSVFS